MQGEHALTRCWELKTPRIHAQHKSKERKTRKCMVNLHSQSPVDNSAAKLWKTRDVSYKKLAQCKVTLHLPNSIVVLATVIKTKRWSVGIELTECKVTCTYSRLLIFQPGDSEHRRVSMWYNSKLQGDPLGLEHMYHPSACTLRKSIDVKLHSHIAADFSQKKRRKRHVKVGLNISSARWL